MKQFKNKKQIFLSFLALFFVCIAIAYISLILKYDESSNIISSIITALLTSMISLPKSLLDLIHVTEPNEARYPLVFFFLYWVIYSSHIIFIFKKKSVNFFVSFSIFNIASSINWFIVSWAVMGI